MPAHYADVNKLKESHRVRVGSWPWLAHHDIDTKYTEVRDWLADPANDARGQYSTFTGRDDTHRHLVFLIEDPDTAFMVKMKFGA